MLYESRKVFIKTFSVPVVVFWAVLASICNTHNEYVQGTLQVNVQEILAFFPNGL
jgi:hypothetical protein